MSPPDLLVVAGEASGDQHGARLLDALREHHPDLEAWGLGGDRLRAAGLASVADSQEISVVGLVEVLKIYRRARAIFRALLAEVDRRGTRTAVLIDFSGFNLRLARALEARGMTVIYYVSPQVWAWRRGRVETIAQTVDRMLVLFRFEVDFYRRHGVDATWVGHPLVETVPELPQAWDTVPAGASPEPTVLALLPGSRRSEVGALLPAMLVAARRLAATRPVRARLIRAPGLPQEVFDRALAAADDSADAGNALELEVVRGDDRFPAIAASHLALCASGTATLEVGLLGTPMLMLYRVSLPTYLLGRLMVRLPSYAMVNLVLGERVVPELVQGRTRPDRLAAEATALLDDRPRLDAMRRALSKLRARLGAGGASARAAAEVAPLLRAPLPASERRSA